MQTRDLGRAFCHLINIRPGTPLVHRAPTIEIEEPFRRSLSVIIRLPFRRALVLGWWRTSGWDEKTALMEAVSGWGLDPYDESLEDPEVKQTIRENIAKAGLDPDSEWTIVSALGVQ